MYRALETPTTIRLLDLHPGREADSISCSLRHCDLDDDPDYEAISYVWGEPVFSVDIECDGQAVYITPGLQQVLKRVRLVDAKRTIWADGLCINQKDDTERSTQVQLMRQIYSNASRVLVWLGPDTNSAAADAFSLCRAVSDAFVTDILSNPERSDELLIAADDTRWPSLQSLVGCPWWTRVWVLQELRLARVASILWGPEEIDWSHIQHTSKHLGCIVFPRYPTGVSPLQFTLVNFFVSGHAGEIVRTETVDRHNDYSIITLLRGGTKLSCSDDRDRIYGILGVTDERGQIVPDYTKTVSEVYWDFAIWLLRGATSERNTHLKLGELFAHVKHERVLHKWTPISLPSWVPRWNITGASWFSTSFIVSEAFEKTFRIRHGEYTLAKLGRAGETPDPSQFPDTGRPDVIHVSAAFLDEVTSLSSIFDGHSPSSILDTLLTFWIRNILPLLREDFHRDFLSELCLTLAEVHGLEDDCGLIIAYLEWALALHEREAILSATHSAQCHTLLEDLKQRAEAQQQPDSQTPDSDGFSLNTPQHREWFFREALPERLRFKRLLLTKEGCLGLVPAACTVGDQIAILPDVGAPMLLRQQDTFYQVVGPSCLALFEGGDVVTEDVQKAFDRARLLTIELR
ncbi:heterokaryon incompatibility protein-domain-containing protein [Paraphoma chrysanthemicola]|uniref:Heterokaryon incompatibility protein-domain-containing protein n=1 Tax=Paraphoma chrysanthemicola TaxID=798071 RepID=A0A8K0QRT8_9PLEO|nr:heterokaryon incompatibility protein-domain-containing protein [Paraphoma chrysanthemicola]